MNILHSFHLASGFEQEGEGSISCTGVVNSSL
jgi:hypothetical protein